ncbi:type I-E CRISPR-associated protein Cas6/Cse3/CasE [Streptomyces sp. SAT1]|uniref:type I-E CRISPR-associated protein Cas6/Cse3/CasE n=1 Tax=Streptomyces sp. SAT1 TaxID=1849967 RepID=UPI0007DD5919|nr:type I-E CRISPR-associated protein Cas6/Cse3/CasE [Streptomyces sp. SAT1]ANH93157.1 type I-E CRISPR-associated protein Cas6/Cse3/CasE [Streptomyces sp. SAT1]
MTATPIPAPRTAYAEEAVPQAWLTRLVLNPAHRQVHRDLGNTALLHRRVMSLLPDGLGDSPRATAGVLFRLDTAHVGPPVLLVQTRVAVDTVRLPNGYAETQTRDMTPMLTALRSGLPVRYRFLGNAVRRCGRTSTAGSWKQAIPLSGEDAARWWADRASASGLALRSLLPSTSDPMTAYHAPASRRGGRGAGTSPRQDKDIRVPYAATLYEGVAVVRDPVKLRVALLAGIGRGKSYGCGLLSLAPAPLDG